MADRFPPSLLILLAIMTVAVLVISVAGIWDEQMPLDFPGGGTESDPTESPPPDREPSGPPPDTETVPPGTADAPRTGLNPAPASTRVTVVWERLDAEAPSERPDRDRRWSGHAFEPPKSPEVRGRLKVHTAAADRGVMQARVLHGTPLRCTVKRVPGQDTETTIEYEGHGLHARILELVTGSGHRVRRYFRPGGTGGPDARIELTPPAPLEGSVIGPNGRPVAGATVRIGPTVTTTDGAGRFRIAGVRGRRVPVYVSAPRHAPHREIVEVPEGFGSANAPDVSPVIRLRPGVRLEVRVRFPKDFERDGPGIRFYLIPFGHRLAPNTLAVENLGPFDTDSGDAIVVPGFPVDQEICLVGVHPRLDLLYRRVRANETDLRIDLAARPRTEVKGIVVDRRDGRPLSDFRLDTPLDILTLGEYLVAERKIPGGHEPGNFPLPDILGRVLAHTVTDGGEFRLAFLSEVRRAVQLRVRSDGLRTEIVPPTRLRPNLEVRLGAGEVPAARGASIELAVRLAGQPAIESFTCEGLDPVARPLIERGRIRAVIGNVPLGRYRVRVEASGYSEYARTLAFSAATTRRVTVFLAVR